MDEAPKIFPLEKIFGSRTRVKIIALFTTGIRRPYYVREIARTVNERLNAVRRELGILQKIGMLATHDDKRRKYYTLNPGFILVNEFASIMRKVGPGIQDILFRDLNKLGKIKYVCLSGYFTGAQDSPTDLLIVGQYDEKRLSQFISQIEVQINREIDYTPMTESEYKYRRNFNDQFLRQIFRNSHKELLNVLPPDLQPNKEWTRPKTSAIVRS